MAARSWFHHGLYLVSCPLNNAHRPRDFVNLAFFRCVLESSDDQSHCVGKHRTVMPLNLEEFRSNMRKRFGEVGSKTTEPYGVVSVNVNTYSTAILIAPKSFCGLGGGSSIGCYYRL